MKKSLKVVCSILLLSFVLHSSGVLADTEKFFAGIQVKAWAAGTQVTTAEKTSTGRQKLYMSSYFNRNLKGRIVSTESDDALCNGDTGYEYTFYMGDGFNTFYIGTDLNAGATTYVYFPGKKTLYLKTTGIWYDATSVSGQWSLTA